MRWIVFLLVTLTFSNAHAQSGLPPATGEKQPPDSLTVDVAVATALQNNYDIQLARNDSAIAAIDYSYRDLALLPQVNAATSVLFNNNDQNVTLADGTKRDRSGIRSNNVNASVGLNWIVFDGLKMFVARTRAAELLSRGSYVIKQQVNNTIADVIVTYYSIVRATLQVRVIEELIRYNEERYQLAKARFEIGVGVKPDMLQAAIDLNAQKGAKLTQLVVIEQNKQNLNRLMNIGPETQYKVSDTIPIDLALDLPVLQTGLEQTNPQLQLTRKNIDVAALIVRERRAERLPVISLGSAYNFSKNENNSVVNPAQPLSSLNKGFNYGINANIPIFNNFNTRRLIRQAELSMRFQETVYENQRALIVTGIVNAYKSYQLQKDVMLLEESNIELAKENLFIAKERYRLAATTFLESREAEQSLQAAYDRLIAARFNMKVAETELLRLTGRFVQ